MGKELGVYCGIRTGENLLVTEDKVEMTFKSDDKVEQRGYYLKFSLVSQAPLLVSHGKWGHKEVCQVYLLLKILFLYLISKMKTGIRNSN